MDDITERAWNAYGEWLDYVSENLNDEAKETWENLDDYFKSELYGVAMMYLNQVNK